MALMANLFVGVSGLQTSQNALNTTAHNLSNVNTVGYTRQQVLQNSKVYETLERNPKDVAWKQTGLGVNYAKTRQVRDYFLDLTYRRETGRLDFYETSYGVICEVENLMGELYGATYNDSLVGLKEAMDELAKTPCDSVVQGLVVQRASQFVNAAQSVYQGLSDYQDNLNLQIAKNVDKINEYGKRLRDLNNQVLKIESNDQEEANDLRDARNQILDELSQLVSINYSEDAWGNVRVQIEGHDFVLKDTVYFMGYQADNATGFYTPFWLMDADYTIHEATGNKIYNIEGAEVFNTRQRISPEWNTDVGGLKALVLARGDHRATYEDLEDADHYNKDISQSIIMNIQAEFDRHINSIITSINQILYDTAAQNAEHPYNVKEIDEGQGVTSYQPIILFSRKGSEDFARSMDDDGNPIWVIADKDSDPLATTYSVMNIVVNPDLVKSPTLLGLRKEDGKEDIPSAQALANVFQSVERTLNPNTNMKFNPMNYYDGLVSQIANSGNIYKGFTEAQENTVEATYNNREQVHGVSSDEELSYMIKFQNAYNASSRYINVVDEMLEHILERLG